MRQRLVGDNLQATEIAEARAMELPAGTNNRGPVGRARFVLLNKSQ
jgi:hypothetical protein